MFHGRGQKYQLLWKERLGFARLAIEFGYPIVPFAAVGAEEMFDIVADRTTPGLAQVYALMSGLVGVPLPPIARGIGPTLIPRPERLYFWFGEPIDTARFDGRAEDDDAARQLRDQVRAAVHSGIEFLLAEREVDPRRGVIRRMLHVPAPLVADPDAHLVARAFDAMNEAGAESAAAWMSHWVQLEDPPAWPGADVWRGRAAVIARLDEVIAELGAAYVEVEDARSVAEGVLARLKLRTRDRKPRQFYTAIEIDGNQIVRIRVYLDEQAARVALSQPGHDNRTCAPACARCGEFMRIGSLPSSTPSGTSRPALRREHRAVTEAVLQQPKDAALEFARSREPADRHLLSRARRRRHVPVLAFAQMRAPERPSGARRLRTNNRSAARLGGVDAVHRPDLGRASGRDGTEVEVRRLCNRVKGAASISRRTVLRAGRSRPSDCLPAADRYPHSELHIRRPHWPVSRRSPRRRALLRFTPASAHRSGGGLSLAPRPLADWAPSRIGSNN